jgi:hypothetical protein
MAHLEVKPKSKSSTWWIWLLIVILIIIAIVYFLGGFNRIADAGIFTAAKSLVVPASIKMCGQNQDAGAALIPVDTLHG